MAVTSKANVRVVGASGDTIAGPLNIQSLRLVAGADASRATIAVGGVTIYDSGSVAAAGASVPEEHEIRIGGGLTATITMTGTTPKLYIYLK